MKGVLVAAGASLILTLLGTPLFIRFLIHRQYGQFVRDDGPTSHHTKRGTPTMGGAVIVGATLVAYALAHGFLMLDRAARGLNSAEGGPSASGMLVLFLMAGLALVGFADDFIKISRQRSLGLSTKQKLLGQGIIGITFAVLVLRFPDRNGVTPASTALSFVRDTGIDLAVAGPVAGVVLFVLWANFIITAMSNGANLTDGLDGLAAGASTMIFAAYVLIGIWSYNQNCATTFGPKCYEVRDSMDVALVAASLMGACFGFLWWNASPAQIFMGDTGSLGLGGAIAGLAIVTRTEFLSVVLAGLFVIEALSVLIQVGVFKSTRKRFFRMAPLHHHFEMLGWEQITVVIRFWIIAGLFVAFGLGLFYAEWVVGAT
ncbi:MAG: phospho-N-acetylmuramoyl-pentapeptide-transferase [Dermatophilaceae bacterium]|jgi:phospho-N-acetylmuramoyl-pentapeptide-transferase|nr:phospho-N-acetylmuramoyl-pentapeptide-transferase [Actinomycetales bacterium]MBP8879588.1 phospho-N-acetylmuramoyl-pentapeptide-transferase [Dermatophilaceae bacterium]MBP9917445.1 phospho-N-acetylmuramoyl-pentapeptide-transferase [Dermatophilaceae bacterium]